MKQLAIPTEKLLLGLEQMYAQWMAQGSRLDVSGRLPSGAGVGNVAPICQAIEVTSSTADTYGYPARIQTYDGSTWSDTYETCRAVQIGSTIAGAVLATGFYPIGRLMYVSPTGLHVYGVFPGSGASVELKGLTFTSDTGSTADSDPGAGLFKWNNATQSSATVLYFDDLTADGLNIAPFWASLFANHRCGYLYIQQGDDSSIWQKWKWTAIADGTGYHKFSVTFLNGNTIPDAKTCYCLFTPAPQLSAARAYSDGQTIANATETELEFAGTTYDTDSYFDISVPKRLTAPFVGNYLYRVVVNVMWAADATGARAVNILKSDGTYHSTLNVPAVTTGVSTHLICTADIPMTNGQYVTSGVQQTSGGNLDVTAEGATYKQSHMSIQCLGKL